MEARIQIRRDTTVNWNSENPILSSGELGLDTDLNLLKIGDGSTAWNSLDGIKFPNDRVQLGSIVGIPKVACSLENPTLSYTPRSFLMNGSDNYLNVGRRDNE